MVDSGTSLCVESCPEQYYENEGTCTSCSTLRCLLCESATNCSFCLSGFYLSSRIPGRCVSRCEMGEIEYETETRCIASTKRFPEGVVQYNQVTRIELEFPIPIKKGSGSINIYDEDESLYLSIPLEDALVFNMLLFVSLERIPFSYEASYSIEVSSSSILALDDSPMTEIEVDEWIFTIEAYTHEPLVAICLLYTSDAADE